MTLLVSDLGATEALDTFLNQTLKMRLFSNDKIPAEGDTIGDYTEISGGGYALVSLDYADWTIAAKIALYLAIDFSFSGTTDAPGTVYGYTITDDSDVLLWAERFPEAVLPFIPTTGSVVRITPRLEAD